MAWTLVREVTIGPNDVSVPVGGVTLGAGDDTLWVRATMLSPSEPWEYSYGLLYWLTPEGRELGVAKCWPQVDGEVMRLGVGLPPAETYGGLFFDSRWVNRRWLDSMGTTLQMRFEVQSGQSGGGSAISGSFVSPAGVGLTLARVVFP